MSSRSMRRIRHGLLPLAMAAIIAAVPASARQSGSAQSPYPEGAVVQPLDQGPSEELRRALLALTENPRSLSALINAGRAAIALGDGQAALTFFARGEEVSPSDPRVKAGMASAMVLVGEPRAALSLFEDAVAQGAPEIEIAADRGLAYDLTGEPRRAQQDYVLVLRRRDDEEVRRRLALSLAISGQREAALRIIDAQLRANDRAAWRTQAFVLALTGDAAGANRTARGMMPANIAEAMAPFLARLDRLSPEQQAMAVHLGRFPSDGRPAPTANRDLRPDPGALALAQGGRVPASGQRADPADRQPARTESGRSERRRPARSGAESAADRRQVGTSPGPRLAEARTPQTQPQVRTMRGPASAPARGAPTGSGIPSQTSVAATAPSNATSGSPTPGATIPRFGAVPAQPSPPPITAAAPPPAATGATAAGTSVSSVDPDAAAGPPPAPAVTAPTIRTTSLPPSSASPIGESAQVGAAGLPVRQEQQADIAAAASAQLGVRARGEAAPSPGFSLAPEGGRPDVPAETTAARPSLADVAALVRTLPREATPQSQSESRPPASQPVPTPQTERSRTRPTNAQPRAARARAPARPAHPSRHWVQIAGGANRSTLPREFARIRALAPELLGRREAWTTPLRATNRLLVGPFPSASAAQAFVNQLARSDVPAFAWTSEAGQEIERLQTRR